MMFQAGEQPSQAAQAAFGQPLSSENLQIETFISFFSTQLSTLKKWTIGPRTVGPRGPTVRPEKMDNWAPDSWAPGQLGPGQLGPGKETLQMTYIPQLLTEYKFNKNVFSKCQLRISNTLYLTQYTFFVTTICNICICLYLICLMSV